MSLNIKPKDMHVVKVSVKLGANEAPMKEKKTIGWKPVCFSVDILNDSLCRWRR